MGLNIYKFLISQNISADLQGPKKKINCTMDDVRGCFLGLPHITAPAAVTPNKIKVSSLKSRENIQKKSMGQTVQFRILNSPQ